MLLQTTKLYGDRRMSDVIGVILGGGLSSRMGFLEKGLLTIGDVSLLGRVKVRLKA